MLKYAEIMTQTHFLWHFLLKQNSAPRELWTVLVQTHF
jgi:hypothetical protein